VSGGAIVKSASNLDILELNAVDSDAQRQDAEILIKVKISSLTTTHYVAIVRGTDSGTVATADGYVVALRAAAIRTFSKVNNTFTQISSATKTHSNDTYYWVRLRVNSSGDTVQARSWADGSSEGGTWECDATDTAVGVVDGYCGLHGTANTATVTWDACGVGTNGDTAPSSASSGISGTLSATLDAATLSAAGTLLIVGSLGQSLGALTLSSAGAIGGGANTGTLSQTLGAATLTSAGTLLINGALSQTLGSVTLAATGQAGAVTTAALNATLGAATLAATGKLPIVGAVAQNLGTLTLASAGKVPVVGSASITLGQLTIVATGFSGTAISAALSQALGALVLSSEGTSVADNWTPAAPAAGLWTPAAAAAGAWTPQ
jgi:hypothetical protein